MRHFKALRTRTWFAISLILGFALVTFGCETSNLFSSGLATNAIGKNQVLELFNFEISAQAVPEGILVTFSNYSNIPSEIDNLAISVYDWGGSKDAELKIWDDGEPFAVMNSLSKIHGHTNCENLIERARQTGTIIFPFVQPGRKYEISAYFSIGNDWETQKIARAECVADGGIYIDRDISIKINDVHTSVALSSEFALTSDVHLEQKFYYITIHGGHLDWITSGETNDLFWDFEPQFREHLKEAGLANGDYPANVCVCLKVIHDNISWMLESVKTPVFTYSL